jgi:hypothetical protein
LAPHPPSSSAPSPAAQRKTRWIEGFARRPRSVLNRARPKFAVGCKAEAARVAIYVNKKNGFQQTETIARECPHCGAHAQLLPLAAPSFEALISTRPRHVGIVLRCALCNEPRFVRTAVHAYEPERVELAANFAEIERARERFPYSYLPAELEPLLREAFECHTAGCYNAFASMCRRTVRRALEALPGSAPRRWQEHVREALEAGEVDARTGELVTNVLFGDRIDPPEIGADEAAVLIEIVKDLLHMSYVRTAKLQAAMRMRRYFASEAAHKVTPINRVRRETA